MKRKWLLISVVLVSITAITVAGRLFINYNNKGLGNNNLPAAKDEFTKLYGKFLDPSATFYMKGKIRLYEDSTKARMKEQSDFIIFKKQSTIFSSLASLNTYCDGKYIVQLDTVNKMLTIAAVKDEEILRSIKNPIMPFEDMFTDTARMQIRGTVSETAGGGRSIYIQTDFIPEIKSMKVFYNPNDYVMRSSEISWWQNPGIIEQGKDAPVWITSIDYTYPDDAGPDVNALMKDIFTIENNTAIIAEKYKGYRVQTNL